jgi:hypothetical protein
MPADNCVEARFALTNDAPAKTLRRCRVSRMLYVATRTSLRSFSMSCYNHPVRAVLNLELDSLVDELEGASERTPGRWLSPRGGCGCVHTYKELPMAVCTRSG